MTKAQHLPQKIKAKSVTSNHSYKRGFSKSPAKLLRIKDALSEIDNGMSIRQTAKKYFFSASFLRRRLTGEVSVESRNGPSPVFNSEEESELAKWLSEMAKSGMGLGPSDFLDFVQGIIRKEKRETEFKNDRPSYTWYYHFIARNSHIVGKRKESSIKNSRAKVTSKQLDEWLDNYYKFVSQLHLLDEPHISQSSIMAAPVEAQKTKMNVSQNVHALPSPLTTYALRLKPGEEIVSSLKQLVEDKQLEAAFILTCVGSVTKAKLRMADSVTIKTYEKGHYEIVSLVGTLSAEGHLHGSFSDEDGNVFGGHVVGDLFVYTTAEIVVGECSGLRFKREHDDATGYKELVMENK